MLSEILKISNEIKNEIRIFTPTISINIVVDLLASAERREKRKYDY